jgi:hypothetical protein
MPANRGTRRAWAYQRTRDGMYVSDADSSRYTRSVDKAYLFMHKGGHRIGERPVRVRVRVTIEVDDE